MLDIILEILKIYGITGGALLTLVLIYKIILALKAKTNDNGYSKTTNDIWIEIREQHAENNLYLKSIFEEHKGANESIKKVSNKLDTIIESIRDAKNTMGKVEKIYTKK